MVASWRRPVSGWGGLRRFSWEAEEPRPARPEGRGQEDRGRSVPRIGDSRYDGFQDMTRQQSFPLGGNESVFPPSAQINGRLESKNQNKTSGIFLSLYSFSMAGIQHFFF